MRIILAGGFLGSGKTSLVAALAGCLLERGRRVLVLENEAGRASLDDAFLASAGLEVRSILGGCACCDLRPRLLELLERILKEGIWDEVLLEPSGVASLGGLTCTLRENLPAGVRVEALAVLDATRFKALAKALSGMLRSQLTAARAAVISKADLASPLELAALMGSLGQLVPGLPAWPAALLSPQARATAGQVLDWLESGEDREAPVHPGAGAGEPAPHRAWDFTLDLPPGGAEPEKILEMVRALAGELFTPQRPGHAKLLAREAGGAWVLAGATGTRDASLRGGGGAPLSGPASLCIITQGGDGPEPDGAAVHRMVSVIFSGRVRPAAGPAAGIGVAHAPREPR